MPPANNSCDKSAIKVVEVVVLLHIVLEGKTAKQQQKGAWGNPISRS
jgi:hypothetical protein